MSHTHWTPEQRASLSERMKELNALRPDLLESRMAGIKLHKENGTLRRRKKTYQRSWYQRKVKMANAMRESWKRRKENGFANTQTYKEIHKEQNPAAVSVTSTATPPVISIDKMVVDSLSGKIWNDVLKKLVVLCPEINRVEPERLGVMTLLKRAMYALIGK